MSDESKITPEIAEECSIFNRSLRQGEQLIDGAKEIAGLSVATKNISYEHMENYCEHTEKIETAAALMTPPIQRVLNQPNYRFCNFGLDKRIEIFKQIYPNHGRFNDRFAAEDFAKDLVDLFEKDNDGAYCKADHAAGFDVPAIPSNYESAPSKTR